MSSFILTNICFEVIVQYNNDDKKKYSWNESNLQLFENRVHIEGKGREASPLQANVKYLRRHDDGDDDNGGDDDDDDDDDQE